MSVSIEVDVCAHLKYHADLGVQRDSLLPRDLEVLHKVDYRVPVRRPRILGESDALMRPIGDVRPSDLLKKVDLSHDRLIVEFLVERLGGRFAVKDLLGQSGIMSRRGVCGEMDVVDDTVDYLRLC